MHDTYSERPAATAGAPTLSVLADDTANTVPVLVVGAGLALAIASSICRIREASSGMSRHSG